MSTTEPTTLYAKLAEVTAEVGYVAKDGHNDFQNYDYTSAEAVLAAIRGPLSARKVMLMPSLTALSEREYTTAKGKASVITTAHVSFTFVDGESGESHTSEWAGEGDDPGDKGLGKAYTNAIKTFVRAQFLIPQGDDPEADRKTDERAGDRTPGAPLGQPMDVSLKTVIGGACRQLCGDDAEKGRALFMAVKKDCDGVMPQAAALALIDAAEAVHRLEHPETLEALEVD